MANAILITGAAGRVGAVGRTVTELLLKQGKAVREMVRNEDQRAQALRRLGECRFRSESINSHFPHISRDVTNVVRHANATNVNAT
jgi:nucleoside-diphosphate-sugar epimerase